MPAPTPTLDSRPRGRRGESRVRLAIPARIVLLSGTVAATLEDLSTTGARLACPARTDAGACGVLAVAAGRGTEIEAFGTIVWQRGGRIGFRFDEAMPLVDVVRLRHHGDRQGEHQRQKTLRIARDFAQGPFSPR